MAESLASIRGVVNNNVESFTNVRTGPATDRPIAFRMDRGSICTVLGEVTGKPYRGKPWYEVEQNGQHGYGVAHNIDLVRRIGRVNENVQSFTNVRMGAATSEPIAFQMDRGSTCTVLGEVTGKLYKGKPWYEVEQNEQRGYAVAHNVDIVPMHTAPLEMPHGKEVQAAQGISPGSGYSMKVTEHITYGEIAMLEEERRFQNQGQCDICLELCLFIERVRAHFGNNLVTITSGHRPPEVNRRVKGAEGSEHLYRAGEGAIDFVIENVDINRVQKYCDDNWAYSVGFGAPKGFIHLGIRASRPRVRWPY